MLMLMKFGFRCSACVSVNQLTNLESQLNLMFARNMLLLS